MKDQPFTKAIENVLLREAPWSQRGSVVAVLSRPRLMGGDTLLSQLIKIGIREPPNIEAREQSLAIRSQGTIHIVMNGKFSVKHRAREL